MFKRRIIFSVLLSLLVFVLILAAIISWKNQMELKVIFLDVGQGDSILIEQGSNQILIDGGKDGKLLLEKLGKYVPFWDRNIEMIVESHPDADHIGGLIEIFRTYNVETVLKTNMESSSQTFKTLEAAIEKENSQVVQARSDEKIIFPDDAKINILFPFTPILRNMGVSDTNAESVVVKLDFGQNKFLFTGDLPIEQEQEIIEKIRQGADDVKADVLKVAHHGSKYSSSDEFLDAVGAKDAIISVGKNNVYGHPNQEALQRLIGHNLNIIRTDEVGDIEYDCEDISSKCTKY